MSDDSKIEIPIIGDTGPLLKTIAGLGSLVAGAFTFKKMIDNAIEAENATNALNNAMKISGTYSAAASEAFQNYSKTLQQTTGVSDDLINQNASLLVSLGRLEGEGLKRATKAALDFSAATGKDVDTAFQIMAKAATGSTEALGKYGLKIDEGYSKSQKFAQALGLIEQRFGGLAEGKMNTFDGSLTRLMNGFNDLLEEMGKLFTSSPVLIAFIKEIAKAFEMMGGSVEKFGKNRDVIGDMIKLLLDYGQVIIQYVMPPMELMFNAGKVVFNSIKAALQDVLVVLLKVAEGWVGLANIVGLASDKTYNNLKMMSQSAGEVSAQMGAEVKTNFAEMFNFDATLATTNFVSRMQQVAAAAQPVVTAMQNQVKEALDIVNVGDAFNRTLEGMGNAAQEFAQKGSENFRKIGQSMFASVGNAAGQAFAAFGKAIAKGENAIQAFLNSLLASMGQMAIQLGVQFMLQGAAYMWAGMPNGPSLIAAGAALAAFGGVLSAIGGGGGAGAGADAGGGGGGGSSASSSMVQQDEVAALEPRKPETNIVVQVMGNILDRRQTGLEIAEVMQETFGMNGINYKT